MGTAAASALLVVNAFWYFGLAGSALALFWAVVAAFQVRSWAIFPTPVSLDRDGTVTILGRRRRRRFTAGEVTEVKMALGKGFYRLRWGPGSWIGDRGVVVQDPEGRLLPSLAALNPRIQVRK